MALFAELVVYPGGVVAWGALGLVAGWLAGKVMAGGAWRLALNVALGLGGALAGGFLYGLVMQAETGVGGDVGLWPSLGGALVGAGLALALARHLGLGRNA